MRFHNAGDPAPTVSKKHTENCVLGTSDSSSGIHYGVFLLPAPVPRLIHCVSSRTMSKLQELHESWMKNPASCGKMN